MSKLITRTRESRMYFQFEINFVYFSALINKTNLLEQHDQKYINTRNKIQDRHNERRYCVFHHLSAILIPFEKSQIILKIFVKS